jgi:VWFA-related protein
MRAGVLSCSVGILLASLLGCPRLNAQQPADIQRENGVYTLRADTHLVLLDVTVTDKQGHPVAGLTKDDFKLLEDGQPQTVKFFEEHAPVDAAEIARQKAAVLAAQPPNTFTNYEPLTGKPVTVLLLNELFFLPERDFNPQFPQLSPLRQRMIEGVQNAPPDTPFAIYMLDSELRLVQPVTTNRALLLARIDVLWKTPHFGSERMINSNGKLDSRGLPPAEDIPIRRSILSDAMQHLASSLKEQPGRKNLYVFTGGFQCSVVGSPELCPDLPFPKDSMDYLCGLMDTLEQGRMSIYRYYPMGGTVYGFGCSASADLGGSANYYTLYYTPANGNWNGKYRATTVSVADNRLHLTYRRGYYGTPENAEAHYYTSKGPAAAPIPPAFSGPALLGTTVAVETAHVASPNTGPTETASAQQVQLHRRGSENLSPSATAALSRPSPALFSVQVIPAEATAFAPDAKGKENRKQAQECRQLTLHFTMPASEFKLVQSDAGQYAARLEMGAVAYSEGRLAPSNATDGAQVTANFNGTADPRLANFTITATLTLNILEHGKNRWLYVSVRDLATGQLGSMVIPMERVKLPAAQ